MIIDCISDLHGYYPKLEGGDLLIIAGDLTYKDKLEQHEEFCEWLDVQPYRKKVVISGNHDNNIDPDGINCLRNTVYLFDSVTEFHGLKIWGSPWTKTFPSMNPKYKAFTLDTEEELAEKWSLIPNDIDILITHSPAYGILDKTITRERVGSKSLQMDLFQRIRPKLFVCGHVHEGYGVNHNEGFLKNAINVSHVNERYEPVNKPVRIVL